MSSLENGSVVSRRRFLLWNDSLVAGKLVGSYTVAGYYLLQQKNHYIVAAASHWLG